MDTRYWIQDINGYKILDTRYNGYKILDTRYWIQDITGYKILDTKYNWIQDTGFKILNTGYRIQARG